MTKQDETKAAARRAAREQRRAAQRQVTVRAQRRRLLVWGGGSLVVIATVAVVVALTIRGPAGPGSRIGIIPPGLNHLPDGQRYAGYNSNPPTSGPHWASPAGWGAYREPLADETLVHNLEHGGVWISYKDAKDTDLADKLAAIARRYERKVIVTPRPANDAVIALAAWGRLQTLEAFDEAPIVAFIEAYRGKTGPEAKTAP